MNLEKIFEIDDYNNCEFTTDIDNKSNKGTGLYAHIINQNLFETNIILNSESTPIPSTSQYIMDNNECDSSQVIDDYVQIHGPIWAKFIYTAHFDDEFPEISKLNLHWFHYYKFNYTPYVKIEIYYDTDYMEIPEETEIEPDSTST